MPLSARCSRSGVSSPSDCEGGRPLQAADDDPQARDAMRRAGEARRAGRLDEARTLYRYVLQRWPHHAEALRTLRDLAIDERNWDEAIALQERLLEIAPPADRPAESSWLAVGYYELGRLELARGAAGRRRRTFQGRRPRRSQLLAGRGRAR